jgi:hypothetical protein
LPCIRHHYFLSLDDTTTDRISFFDIAISMIDQMAARYWSSSDETIRRLEWAAKHYKNHWKDFIRDSAKPEAFWEKRDYGFSLGLRYLVRFLILVDQKELAARYAAALVAILIEEVADQPVPEIPWLR